METSSSDLITRVENHVRKLLDLELSKSRHFHNIDHTAEVVKKAMALSAFSNFDLRDSEDLAMAAWFHDTGYIKSGRNHEEHSVNIATDFLMGKRDIKSISTITALIRSTKIPTCPSTPLQNCLCDADLSHLGSKNYEVWQKKLREEFKVNGLEFSDNDWLRKNISFFNDHHYYSAAAQQLWGPQKQINLENMRKSLGNPGSTTNN